MKNNKYLEYLYDLAKSENEDGSTYIDKEKVKKEMTNNNTLFRSNKDIFAENEKRYHTCKMYNPCPLCYKCMSKASHLFEKCGECKIPICVHKYQDKKVMIRRENFKIPNNSLLANIIKETEEEFNNLGK